MKRNLASILWVVTVILMVLSIAVDFFHQHRLSLVNFIFVLALALSAVGSSVTEWLGGDSKFVRFWHSRPFAAVLFLITFVVVILVVTSYR